MPDETAISIALGVPALYVIVALFAMVLTRSTIPIWLGIPFGFAWMFIAPMPKDRSVTPSNNAGEAWNDFTEEIRYHVAR